MAMQQVNSVRLKTAGKTFTDLSLKMKKEMAKLDESIQKISSIWTSEASASYLKKYQSDKSNLSELAKILQETGTVLTEFSANYQQADDKASDLILKYLKR